MSLLDGVCGTGGWSGPLPGDPDNNVLLTATAVYGGVEVVWTYPAINPHAVAHVRLYRGVSISFANATLHKIVTGNSYYDKIDPSVETDFYYWIEIVSVYGTVGAPIGPASVTAIPTVHQTMQMLTGQINSGTLATALRTEIDVIDQVALDLALETQTRTASETALANAITAVQTENGELGAFILNEANVRAAADSALTSQVNTAVSTLNGDLAAAQTTLQTNINTVDGKVTSIGALYTVKLTVNGLAGGFGVYNDGTEVQAGFDVDTFWVGKDSTDKVKPFIISGGIVYIDSARIADASIDNAKIGNVIQSADYVAGSAGWKIDKAGQMEMNSATFRGALSAATGTFSGALTVDAINAVSTINIGADQVTVPRSAFTSGGINYSSALVQVQSLTVTSSGAPATIIASLYSSGSNSGATTYLYRDGILLTTGGYYASGVSNWNAVLPIFFVDTPSAGSHTYTLSIGNSTNTHTASIRSIIYTEMKR